jgi:hypothetical protein
MSIQKWIDFFYKCDKIPSKMGDLMRNFETVAYNLEFRVDHDLINKAWGNGKKNIPHEWFFINYLYKYEIRKNQELAAIFAMFVSQFYPNYKWHYFNQNNYLDTATYETLYHDFQFCKIYEYNEDVEEDILTNSMLFGDIVTDFLIRFRNYSLVKCSGVNIILTAQSDCHKRFEDLLSNGYSLQKRAKVGYIKTTNIVDTVYPKVNGLFYKLPVLPTRETWYPIDEIIENEEGKYVKVM